VTGNCQKDGESSLYLIDLEQGSATTLHSSQPSCISMTGSNISWDSYSWSPDGAWLFATCYEGNQEVTSCLVSPERGVFSCSEPRESYQLKAWSPDGTRVAIYLPSSEGRDLLITDRTCLQDVQACPEYLRAVISDLSDRSRALGGVIWDAGGETVIWSTYPMDYTTAGFATIWIADLDTGTIDSIAAPRGANVRALSPDGRWFVLSSDEGWMLLSRNGQVLRRLSTEIDYYDYLGWLVIP
jgi:Tol biopolymer transport system component